MPVLPVPEVVKEMATRIDQIAQQVNEVDRKVQRLFDGLDYLKSSEERMRTIGLKVDTLTGSLDVAKDQLAMLCASAERPNGSSPAGQLSTDAGTVVKSTDSLRLALSK